MKKTISLATFAFLLATVQVFGLFGIGEDKTESANWGADGGGFTKTPLGEAAYDNVVQATRFLAKQFEDFSLEGAVVTVSGDRIIINRGSNYNLSPGQKFVILEKGELRTKTTGNIRIYPEG